MPLVVAILALSLTLAGCSQSPSKSAPTPTVGVRATQDTPSSEEIDARVTPDTLPTAEIGVRTATPIQQPSPVPQFSSSPMPEVPLLRLEFPQPGQSIYSPVYVRGEGPVPFERTLEVQVLGVTGETLGRGPILFDLVTPFGEIAAYEGTLPFRQPEQQQLGSVRVLMRSPRDSSIVDYAQVLVALLPAGSGPTDIRIDAPTEGTVIGSPVHVEGVALAPQNQVTVRLKSGPAVVAAETVLLSGEIGQPSPFAVDLSYARFPASSSGRQGYPAPGERVVGHIEVFFRSPKDGRIAEIASIPVVISGQ